MCVLLCVHSHSTNFEYFTQMIWARTAAVGCGLLQAREEATTGSPMIRVGADTARPEPTWLLVMMVLRMMVIWYILRYDEI